MPLTNCTDCKYKNCGQMNMPCRSCCFGSNYELGVKEEPKFVYRGTRNPYFDSDYLIKQLFELPERRKENAMLKIKDVIFNPPATIILWKDGSKTVVKAQDEDFDPEKGMAMAICKKVMGNKGNFNNAFKKYIKPWQQKQLFEDIDEVHNHKDKTVDDVIKQSCAEDTTVTRVKHLYHEGDNTMADILRLYSDLLSIKEKQELIKWAGEDDLLYIDEAGEIAAKKIKNPSGKDILMDLFEHYPEAIGRVASHGKIRGKRIIEFKTSDGRTWRYDYDTKESPKYIG